MYTVDERDRVVELSDLPQSDVGAPYPLVLASEGKAIVVYFVSNPPAGWDGSTVTLVGPGTPGEPAAIIRLSPVEASLFGPPNDEAFDGHPLASRGLHPYGAFEVLDSSWVRRLERMNAVHPRHRPERYATLRHFVLAFHDSTFECIARGYTCELAQGPLTALIGRLSAELAT
jgi:hypothetical protein